METTLRLGRLWLSWQLIWIKEAGIRPLWGSSPGAYNLRVGPIAIGWLRDTHLWRRGCRHCDKKWGPSSYA
jgi:hypothetical protein